MDYIGLQSSERLAAEGTLGNTTLNEFQRVIAGLHAWGDIEHHGDGTHGDITADSLTTPSVDADALTADEVAADEITAATWVRIPDGTVTVPGLGFTSDPQTGLYRESLPFSRSVVHVAVDGVDALAIRASAGNGGQVELPDSPGATGSNAGGPFFFVGRNPSGSGAPGTFASKDRTGVLRYLFFDSLGILRVHTSRPSESGGDLVGVGFGNWLSVTYAAGNFTASTGTWGVDNADQATYAYTIIGKTMTLAWVINATDVSGASVLRLAIPASKLAALTTHGRHRATNNGGASVDALCVATTGLGYIELYADQAANNFSITSSDNTFTSGTFTFAIQ